MISNGGGAALPLFLIIGFYKFEKPWLRVTCLCGALAWMGLFIVMATRLTEKNLLLFPAIVGLGWLLLHPLLKD